MKINNPETALDAVEDHLRLDVGGKVNRTADMVEWYEDTKDSTGVQLLHVALTLFTFGAWLIVYGVIRWRKWLTRQQLTARLNGYELAIDGSERTVEALASWVRREGV